VRHQQRILRMIETIQLDIYLAHRLGSCRVTRHSVQMTPDVAINFLFYFTVPPHHFRLAPSIAHTAFAAYTNKVTFKTKKLNPTELLCCQKPLADYSPGCLNLPANPGNNSLPSRMPRHLRNCCCS